MKLSLTLLFLLLECVVARGFETAYWAWQRNEPPSAAEMRELTAQGVRVVYWQIGELVETGATWRWSVRFELPADTAEVRFVPVVRLESRERAPFSPEANASLTSMLAPAIQGREELQIDYDAPDRLLGEYAATLKQLHKFVPRVSITALPHWARPFAVRQLKGAADEMLVMLYDFEPETKGGEPLPLIVPQKIDRYLSDWHATGIPWRAGLPVFARATVFDSENKSRGHVRAWAWDDICFNSALEVAEPTKLGVTTFRAKRDLRVDNAAVRAGQMVVTRLPDRAALSHAVAGAHATNARGVVFFRFPDSTDPSGWSLRQLGHLETAPRLSVRVNPHTATIELLNDSDADLTFSANASERGYALQIEAAAAIFRDASAGDFWRVAGDAEGRAVAIPLATRLTFWFSHLRAHEALRTGMIRLAPAADFSQAQWRILNFEPQSQSQPLQP
ncbi:MAG TPA: hypothetical protein VJS88_04365 [Chthoniobacterales bacterium]|nr:hypothetical protein [Chthoniobacterales bacterium]